jgi:hypothetical protein
VYACPDLSTQALIALFADDMTLIAATLADMNRLVAHLLIYCEAWGFTVNWVKTEAMWLGSINLEDTITIAGRTVKNKQKFK